MSKKSAKFAAAIAFCVAATFALAAVPRTAHAADECLTEPKGATSPGKHWFYHFEHGTGRKCWYQRGQDDAAAGAPSQDQSADASDDASSKDQDQTASEAPAPIVRPTARRSEAPATRSLADARAEWPAKPRASDNSTAAPATAAAPTTIAAAPAPAAPPPAPSASVFPDPSSVLGTKPAADTSSSDADTQPDTTASVTPDPSASPAPAVQTAPMLERQPADSHRASIPMLLMVAFGALGLAGLIGSTVYRLAGVSRRRQDRWQRNVQVQPAPARRPRRIAARPEPIQESIEEPIHREFEDHRFAHDHDAHDHDVPEQLEADHRAPEPAALELFAPRPRAKLSRAEPPRAETRTNDANGRRAQIEAHLAQLTRQLQADLAAPARAE